MHRLYLERDLALRFFCSQAESTPAQRQSTQIVGRTDIFRKSFYSDQEKEEYAMADIHELLKMLQSDDPLVRYDACEELRVLPTLPPEAVDALYPLTIDENQDVADAAQRAITLHMQMKKESESESSGENALQNGVITKPFTNWQAVGIGTLVGFAPPLLSLIVLVLGNLIYGLSIEINLEPALAIGNPMSIPFGVIGAVVVNTNKKSRRAVFVGGLVGAIIGIGCGFFIFLAPCFGNC